MSDAPKLSKSQAGNFFEDFRLGQIIRHATPRTITEGDVALNIALTGDRHALFCSDAFAASCGFPRAPIDPLLVFHVVFGKTVPDVSRNAVANLGYAEGRFLEPVFPGDTLAAASEVIGLKQNSNGKTGVVHVRTRGTNQAGETVLEYARWVMVNKRDATAPAPAEAAPTLQAAVAAEALVLPEGLAFPAGYDVALAGDPFLYEDYEVGEKIDHGDGITLEEAEHQLATRLYQNSAKVHFDAFAQKDSRFGRRLVYGGVVISLARALSFNGLANASLVLAINGGRHVNPLFAGGTVTAWSEVLEKADLGRAGALRLRLVALQDRPAGDFPLKNPQGEYEGSVLLDLDYWAAIPKRA
ncbi:MAG: MaoC family dehydratase [Hyphomonadaceae bacterium]|nr:MaoC family dehydratase [Hyphomonadaceae bacterium]